LLALLEFLRGCPNAPHDPRDIDLQDLVQFFGRDIGKRLNLRDDGVVDDNVESARLLFSVIDGGIGIVAIPNLGLERRRLTTERPRQSATAFILSYLTSTTAMSAPSRGTMPCPAPVTKATFPLMLMFISANLLHTITG
jgi:hypothetical protein